MNTITRPTPEQYAGVNPSNTHHGLAMLADFPMGYGPSGLKVVLHLSVSWQTYNYHASVRVYHVGDGTRTTAVPGDYAATVFNARNPTEPCQQIDRPSPKRLRAAFDHAVKMVLAAKGQYDIALSHYALVSNPNHAGT